VELAESAVLAELKNGVRWPGSAAAGFWVKAAFLSAGRAVTMESGPESDQSG